MALRLHSFWLKAALAAALVVAADLLLFERDAGSNVGLVSIGLLAAAGLTNRAVWRTRLSIFAFCAALLFGLLQIERPTVLGWLLFAVSLGVTVLAPRAPAVQDAAQWAWRLLAGGSKALLGPWFDARQVLAARRRRHTLKVAAAAMAAALPVVGGAIFLWLFAQANPLIAEGLSGLRIPQFDPGRAAFCAAIAAMAWTALRPRGINLRPCTNKVRDYGSPTFGPGSVAASLVVFNAIFALQNGLDLAFLWSRAPLPAGTSLADYAHRGAYPLIATALLAGLFVLVFLRPGASKAVRSLVTFWIAQNVFLVASTILRTVDYVDAYSLTRMRLAALIWMALVAVGLMLIAWRLLRGESRSWLINANAVAGGVALALCSVIDLGAVAAHWNVRHARDVGGRGVELDLCYLGGLNGAALVSLAELEQRRLPPAMEDAVRGQRRLLREKLQRQQADWRTWRWRDARRLDRDGALPTSAPVEKRGCDRLPNRPTADAPVRPLTPSAKP